MEDSGFIDVPTCLENITPKWCEQALKKGGVIDSSIKVMEIKTDRLVNDETGALDGGGMTLAQMIRIHFTYDSQTDDLPKTCVAKTLMTGELMFNLSLPFRMYMQAKYGSNTEEWFWRTDILFYQECLPLIKHVYSHPKIYYTAIMDGGDRGYYSEVIRSNPHKIRTITLMEDMKGWESQTVGIHHPNFSETVAILKNVASLHGNFWGQKNKDVKEKFRPSPGSEMEVRNSYYSKKECKNRNKFLSTSSILKNKLSNFVKQWQSELTFSVKQSEAMPEWLRTESASEGIERIFILQNPSVLEMLDVFSERYSKFSTDYMKEFIELPPQTLVHGDFHNGNHMYQNNGDGSVKVVALDFQMVGTGMACSDLVKLLIWCRRHRNISEEIELVKEYYEALANFEIENYSYEDMKRDFVFAALEYMVIKLIKYENFGPEKYRKFIQQLFGDEKCEELMAKFKNGLDASSILLVTSMYLNDKENFLKDLTFIENL